MMRLLNACGNLLVGLLLPLLTIPSGGQMIIRPLSGGGGGSPWTQVLDSAGTFQISIGDAASATYIAASFTAANSGTVDSITLSLIYVGTPGAYTFGVYLYDNNAGDPGNALTNGSITGNNYSALTNSYADYQFDFATPPSITASTLYWIVVKADQIDASNYLRMRYNGTGSNEQQRGDATPTWTSQDATMELRATIAGNS